jgi:hypothetical protein
MSVRAQSGARRLRRFPENPFGEFERSYQAKEGCLGVFMLSVGTQFAFTALSWCLAELVVMLVLLLQVLGSQVVLHIVSRLHLSMFFRVVLVQLGLQLWTLLLAKASLVLETMQVRGVYVDLVVCQQLVTKASADQFLAFGGKLVQ